MVDLPDPDFPTIATVSFWLISKFKLDKTDSSEL